MKIALVILHADRSRGGAETYTLDLAHALVTRSHEVTIIATSFSHVDPRVRTLPIDAGGTTRSSRYRSFLSQLDRILAAEAFDVVHAMLPVRKCDVYHPHAGLAIDSVATFRMANLFNPRRWMYARVEQELLSQNPPPVVLALSEYVKRGVRKHYDLPDDRLRTLFNAVDLNRFTEPSSEVVRNGSHELVTVLMVAQDFERKGLSTVLRAIALLGDERLRLVVVGKPNPTKYRKLATRLNIDSKVTFAGAVSDVAAYYHSADFFVLPTKHDPCSLVVLEALATGLPVISTRMNGACEVMVDGKHGFVLDDPENVPQLAGAMQQLLEATTRNAMREACKQLRPALSYETHVSSLIAIYEGVLRSRPGSHRIA